MKMIRRFFTYVITIITILVLAYGYVYWGNLFGEGSPARQLIGWMQAEDKAIAKQPELLLSEIEEPAAEQVPEPEADIKEVLDDDMASVAEVQLNLLPEAELMPIEAVEDEALVSVDAPADAELPAMDATVPAGIVSADDMLSPEQSPSLADLWKLARHSFHYRDFQTSVDSYQQLIVRTQDNFDAYEELGDVYAYYGKNAEAAAAYYEAASMLIRLGKLERAAGFMKALSLMDVSKARALLDQLEKPK